MKKFLISLFIILIPSVLLSDPLNYETDFPIFVFGDTSSIEFAFKFIAKFVGSGNEETIENLTILIGIVLLSTAGWQMFKTQSFGKLVPTSFYFLMGALSMFGDLNTSVHIEDQRVQYNAEVGGSTPVYSKVDGIPYPIALIASVSSTVSLEFMTLVEDTSTDISSDLSDVSFSAMGFAGPYNYQKKMTLISDFNKSSGGKDFRNSLRAYIKDCVIYYGSENSSLNIEQRLRNPSGDIFNSIDPVSIGITNETIYTISYNNTTSSCKAHYETNISDKLSALKSSFETNLDKITNIELEDVAPSLVNILGIDNSNGFLGSAKENALAYMVNYAVIPTIEQAIKDGASGTDLSDAINSVSAKANIQDSGLGQFRWMSEILPFGFHFFLGIIYAISVLVMIVAIALGLEKGLAIISNYSQGLFAFEFVKVSHAYVNNVVNHYASENAYSKLIGESPVSVDNIGMHLDYLATMTGIAGILGVGAIFMIPAMVFTGKVAVAAGAINGLSSQYKGGSQNAMDIQANAEAMETAYTRAIKNSQAKGLNSPDNMGSSSMYAKYEDSLNSYSSAHASLTMGRDSINDAASASSMQKMGNISSLSHVANNTSSMEHINSGAAKGATQVGEIRAESDYVLTEGTESLEKGSEIRTIKSLAAINADSKMDKDDAFNTSYASANLKNVEAVQETNAKKKLGLLDDNYDATSLATQSMKNNFEIKSAEQAGIGKNGDINDKELNSVANQSSGQFQERFVTASAYNNKATDGNGNLTNDYVDALKGKTESGITSMIKTTKGLGGSEKQVEFAEASSEIKAASDAKALKEQLKEAGYDKTADDFGKKAAESFNRAVGKLADVAGEQSGAKTRSDINTIDKANNDKDWKDKGGYRGFASASAVNKQDEGMSSLQGKISAELIDDKGGLTDIGKDSVRGGSRKQAEEQMKRADILNSKDDMKDLANSVWQGEYKKQKLMKATHDDAVAHANATIKDFSSDGVVPLGQNGMFNKDAFNVKTGDDAWGLIGQFEGNAISDKMGRTIINGSKYSLNKGMVNSSTDNSNTVDSTTKASAGKSLNLEHIKPEMIDALEKTRNEDGSYNIDNASKYLETSNTIGWNASWKNQLKTLATSIVNGTSGENPDEQNIVATGAALGLATSVGVGSYGLEKLTQQIMSPEKVALTNKDLTKKKGYEQTGINTFEDINGNEFSLNENGEVVNKDGKTQYKTVKQGLVTKSASGSLKGLNNFFADLVNPSTSNDTSYSTNDTSNNNYDTKTDNPTDDKLNQHSNSSNKDNTIISENGEKSKVKAPTNEQKALSNWIDKQQKSLNLDDNKDLAKYKVLEDLKGSSVDDLDDFTKQRIGLGHNSELNINKASDALNISDDLTKAGNKALKSLPGPLKLFALGMAATTIASAQDEFSQGNYAKSLFTATSLLDPTGASDMVVASMDARENMQEATRGRTLSSGTTQGLGEQIMSSPFMQQVTSLFGSGGNTQQAIQQDMANGSLQSYIQQQANSFIPTNTEALQAQTSVMQLNSLAGPVSFGQTNSRMLRVNGAATQIPYNQFQNSMQTNPLLAQNFAQSISASDMSGISPTAFQGIQNMPTLLSEINQRSSFQEFQAMSSARNVNSVMSMVDEQISMIEDLEDTIDTLRE